MMISHWSQAQTLCKPQHFLVPPVGFEPTTNGLKVHCANQLRHGGESMLAPTLLGGVRFDDTSTR